MYANYVDGFNIIPQNTNSSGDQATPDASTKTSLMLG